jgi:hypothetical protein
MRCLTGLKTKGSTLNIAIKGCGIGADLHGKPHRAPVAIVCRDDTRF